MISNKRRYWFRAKRYGWGWGLPSAWEGWAFFITWLLVFSFAVRYASPRRSPVHLVFAVAMVALLVLVCYWKGEPAKWRWGNGDTLK
jgi:hypothetical protein